MTYEFQDRLDYLGTRMKEINYVSVDYRRGVAKLESLAATPEKPVAEEEIPGLLITRADYQGFIIDSADLLLEGMQATPKTGDEIDWGSEAYKIVSQDEETPPYEYVTSSKTRMRIHTIQIK